MGRQGGLAGIEYGKVKVYTSEESTSLEKTFEVFVKVMKKFGYPEMEDFEEDETEEVIPIDELTDESEKPIVAKELPTDLQERVVEIKDSDPESPWLRAATKKDS